MKILIHGATDQGSSNFGDFIYGNELFKICAMNNNVCFYNPSEYFKKYIQGYSESMSIKLRRADALIYMPGGYFGEVKNASLKRCIKNFFRYMPFGLRGVFFKKNILILGLGAGPIYSFFLKIPLQVIVKNAVAITVRDKESQQALEKIGASNVKNYYDMILSFPLAELGKISDQIISIKQKSKGKKILLIHYNHSRDALRLFANVTKRFIEANDDYMVIVSADSIIKEEDAFFKEFESLCNCGLHYIYDDPFEFIELLKCVDVVLTCKLHTGVVASMLQKSVISVADHYEKTRRYYDLIGQSNRCVALESVGEDDVISMISEYCDCPIIIPEDVKEISKMHYNKLVEFLNLCSKK